MSQDRKLYVRRVRLADAQDHLAQCRDAVETAMLLAPGRDEEPGYVQTLADLRNCQYQLDGLMERLQ